ncbi:MAG: PD-(D/E)XK nuclease family protein, partial [Candidatus Omnitrophota bacterium]|nr:PD-(D/E)XK nuclease family protein [Candidatus Omnitrophota bacterium]
EQFKKEIISSKELSTEEKKNPYNNIAILVRKRSQILRVIDAFLQAGIPYATDGREDIKGEKRVRQLLDVLELASIDPENFKDRDFYLYKILISDYFQIPHKDILSFMNRANKKKKNREPVTLLSELFTDKELPASLEHPAKIIEKLLKEARFHSVHTVLMEYIKSAGIYKFILKKYQTDDVLRIRELRSLSSFINMVKEYDFSKPGITLRDFVEEIRTREQHNISLQGELVTMTQNGVRILTAHSSKGQEFNSVIIPFCLQDTSWPIRPFPDKIPLPPDIIKSMERVKAKEKIKQLKFYDETRLFYVAISRAKVNVLFTSSPKNNRISSSFITRLGVESKSQPLKEEYVFDRTLNKTETEDPFIGTEDVLKDIVSGLALNPTSLNNYLRCKRKFLYDNVLMLPGAKKQSLIFGNAVHGGLERVYRSFMQKNKFPDFQFFKEKFINELKYHGPEKAIELRSLEQFEGLRKYFSRIASNPVKPLGLESKMPINIDGIVFTGKYDRLEFEDSKNGALRVVDYKTGQPRSHAMGIFSCKSLEDEACDSYFRQLVCYKLLYERNKTIKDKDLFVSHGVLMFVEPAKADVKKYGIKKGEPTEFKVELNEDMVDEMVGLIKNAWGDIQALHFEKLQERDTKKCGFCDFDYICWGEK